MLIPDGAAQAQSEGEWEQFQQYNGSSYGEYGHPVLGNNFDQFIDAAL